MATETPTWEAFKENAAPLGRGRNVAILEKSCVETEEDKQRKETLIRHFEVLVQPSEKMMENRITLEEDDGQDPLIHWLSYIKFCQESFPADTQKEFLLLERCTRALVGQHKYRNDVRFIRVCVSYADKAREPREVFRFLHDSHIGTLTAIFWMAWAFWAEKQHDFKLAEKILTKAKSKGAKPKHVIEQRYKQFQRRMARRVRNEQQGIGTEEDDGDGRDSHAVLGRLTEDAFRRNDRSSTRNRNNPPQSRQSHRSQNMPSSNMSTFRDRSARGHGSSRHFSSTQNTTHQKGKSNNLPSSAGFRIFQDGQENDGYNLDHHVGNNENRRLAREKDRRKENTIAAEQWNLRGGLQTANAASRYATAPPSHAPRQMPTKSEGFSVFIDEECEAENQRKELMGQADEDRRRRHRDERTFRQLESGESVAEKLFQDPLRYVKDPSRLQHDEDRAKKVQLVEEEATAAHHLVDEDRLRKRSHRSEGKKATSRTAYVGERLVKNDRGREQCFNEHRAFFGRYKVAPPETNFNALEQRSGRISAVDDSDMDIDENNTTGDRSMEDSTSGGHSAFGSSRTEGSRRALFRERVSFEQLRDRSINVSQCSSTVNEAHAVGEETINTKLAMHEMSMMFCSPADGLTQSCKKTRRLKGEHEELLSDVCHQTSFDSLPATKGAENADSENEADAFSTVMDLVGCHDRNVNKSLVGLGSSEAVHENRESQRVRPQVQQPSQGGARRRAFGAILQGEPSPKRRAHAPNDGHSPVTILEESNEDDEVNSKSRPLVPDAMSQSTTQTTGTGFLIFNEEQYQHDAIPANVSKKGIAFEIHRDDQGNDNQNSSTDAMPQSTSQTKGPGFHIFSEEQEQHDAIPATSASKNGPAFEIHRDDKCDQGNDNHNSSTATTEKVVLVQRPPRPPRTAIASTSNATKTEVPHKETASLSEEPESTALIMKELLSACEEVGESELKSKHSESPEPVDSEDTMFLLFGNSKGEFPKTCPSPVKDTTNSAPAHDTSSSPSIDEWSQKGDGVSFRPKGTTITDPNSFGDISVIDNISLPPNRNPIASPTITFSCFGQQEAVDYGQTLKAAETDALKRVKKSASGTEQCPSLAEILKATAVYNLPKYILPKAFRKKLLDNNSVLKIGHSKGTVKRELGRGAHGIVVLLSMDDEPSSTSMAVKAQASTETLAMEYEILKKVHLRVQCDLFPFPKPLSFVALADGGMMSMTAASDSGLHLVDLVNLYRRHNEKIEDLIPLHYASRMLHHLELLHWHGNILHCDVKPDNWVLCSSQGVDGADLMLVDFGRAIDLADLANSPHDAKDVKMIGDAAEEDMMTVAMKKKRPWSFDTDTFGLCASIHVLLFYSHIEITQDQRTKRWMPKQRFKRYWQTDLWKEVFDTLLNDPISSRPRSLRDLREKLDKRLESNYQKLDHLLKRQSRMLPSGRIEMNPP
ncbi:Mitotic checkpoint serine/threonine-protein kinase BUB1 [Seminavis robusta]|uniref:Mitotic checkpoint serine/threonine-protein kinase BUB1 n=1 Tax=Seminavis robusta TaxID=568900 RepID=A0A9N8HLK5_9STRA|nr:Mitotic checkpoint serine/threonine-protein kinase BUB1 [Seminavis robusta]|eukprot:Sro690_g187690.1 Mitotic checkpoint serine/threonine-protein kinase BUB1 (1441) ;mRNA; r:40467-44877